MHGRPGKDGVGSVKYMEGWVMNGRIWAFAVYSILFETIVWGLFGWAVFVQGRSGWWVLVALLLSSAQLKSKDFGINKEKSDGSGGSDE